MQPVNPTGVRGDARRDGLGPAAALPHDGGPHPGRPQKIPGCFRAVLRAKLSAGLCEWVSGRVGMCGVIRVSLIRLFCERVLFYLFFEVCVCVSHVCLFMCALLCLKVSFPLYRCTYV